jgi:hypothetical protein
VRFAGVEGSLFRLSFLCELCAGVYPDPVGALSFLLPSSLHPQQKGATQAAPPTLFLETENL